jgi:hypothetical protein
VPDNLSIAVIDIDGVVADVRHRLPWLRRRPPRWDLFFDYADDDPLLAVGADLVHKLAEDHVIVWLSGRPDYLRSVTEGWLRRHGLPGEQVELREPYDFRPARIVKLERIRGLSRLGPIAACIDDDPDVIATLVDAGYPAVLADWVPHEKTLHRAQERDGRT